MAGTRAIDKLRKAFSVEARNSYTIKDGELESWLKVFREDIVPLLTEHGIKVESTWVNEDESEFVWIRSYGETEADIEAKEAAFYGSDWWKANVDMVRGHLAGRDIKVLKSV